MLIQYDYSKSSDPLLPWSSHISSLLSRDSAADITIVTATESFRLHKFLLSARSPYFQRKLAAAPETDTWRLPDSIPVEALQVVIRYLYLGDIPKDIAGPNSINTEEEILRGIDKMSKILEVERLWDSMLSIDDRRLARQRHQDEVDRARGQMEDFFVRNVLKHKMVVQTNKVHEIKWPHGNSIFADVLLQADEYADEDTDETMPDGPESGQATTNGIPLGLPLDASEAAAAARTSVLFPVHKAMLLRSPFFEAMFSSSWLEGQASPYLRIVRVDCSPAVLEIVLRFLYAERVDCPLSLSLDLLYAADMLLLDRLKTKTAVSISAKGNVLSPNAANKEDEEDDINIYDVLHAAWDLNVQRLEEFSARYLASRLERFVDDPRFAELIRESAARVVNRHETDTIELLDDIRYYLSERFRLRFEDTGFEEMEADAKAVEAADGADQSRTAGVGDGAPIAVGDHKASANVAGAIKTLDGAVAPDEFEADAMNYEILLAKLDQILEKLNLDA